MKERDRPLLERVLLMRFRMSHPVATLRSFLLVIFGTSGLWLSACTASPESEEEDGSDATAWEEEDGEVDSEVDGEKSPAAAKPGPNAQTPTPRATAGSGSSLLRSLTCNTPECRKLGKK